MSAPLTLVVLAAGMGSRYGGMKQLEGVGPDGETLMDYSVFDALRAGFTRCVFVIRPDMEEAFQAFAAGRYGSRLEVATAHQRLEDLPLPVTIPPGREKPWGTAHAVLAAAHAVSGPFVVVNADDFYGTPAYEAAAGFLREELAGAQPAWAVVGYRLEDTLSASGGVNRGVCRIGSDGWLTGIEEVYGIGSRGPGNFDGTAGGREVPLEGDELVSMNMWAFTPDVFDQLRSGFTAFLGRGNLAKAEYLLPDAVQDAVRAGRGRVRVLDPCSHWYGMTYTADRPTVEAALRNLVGAGQYPPSLWT